MAKTKAKAKAKRQPSNTTHRYFLMDGTLYQITEGNRQKALKMAASIDATDIDIALSQYRAKPVSDQPLEDWTGLTSTQAKAMLGEKVDTTEDASDGDRQEEEDAGLETPEDAALEGPETHD